MPEPADTTSMSDRHYVTLVLRLTLDQMGRLLQGEFVDTKTPFGKRFLGVTGLNQAVETWLHQQEHPAADVSSADLENGNQRGDP
jgi:hypothetical protein